MKICKKSREGFLDFSGAALACAILLASCAADPKPFARSTPLAQKPEPSAEINVTAPAAKPPEPAPPVARIEVSPVPPPPEIPPVAPPKVPLVGEAWFDLAKWCQQSGLTIPTRTGNPLPKWDLRFSGGVLEMAAGNRFAHWNGLLLGLGFPPRATQAGLQIYGIDLDKNILPLASASFSKAAEKVLVLDPGHGGINGGTQSPSTHQIEKNLTLDWAFRIQRILIGSGWTVVLTRTNDVDLTLAQRIAFTDEIDPDLFVSLHFNAMAAIAKTHEETGIETYCLTPAGLPSNITRDFEDDPSKVFPNNQFDLENLQWAVRFHQQLLATTGARDRGVRRARFMGVLRDQRRPAVLIEGGYLSDPHEAKLLANTSYREKLAWAVAAAIVKQ